MKFTLLIFLAILLANTAYADTYHHRTTTNVYTDSKGVAIAAASGQHNYKATTSLQWSVGGAFVNENDDSAVSFGLGQQLGKVFAACNYSSDSHNSIIGCSASGTF